MKFAIKPRGVGLAPGVRAIEDDWPLRDDETFSVGESPFGLVLAEDGQSLRPSSAGEIEDAARARAIAEIKHRAGADIVAMVPEWKQRNMLAAAIDEIVKQLAEKGITIDEEPLAPMRDVWTAIKARREQSDAEEAAISP